MEECVCCLWVHQAKAYYEKKSRTVNIADPNNSNVVRQMTFFSAEKYYDTGSKDAFFQTNFFNSIVNCQENRKHYLCDENIFKNYEITRKGAVFHILCAEKQEASEHTFFGLMRDQT